MNDQSGGERQPEGPNHDEHYQNRWSAERENGSATTAEWLRRCREHPPDRAREGLTQYAGVHARVEYREKHVEQNDQHDQCARNLLDPLDHCPASLISRVGFGARDRRVMGGSGRTDSVSLFGML